MKHDVIKKDPGEVQFDQVKWKVQPDSNHKVQSVWYDHTREACHSQRKPHWKGHVCQHAGSHALGGHGPFFWNSVKCLPEKSWLGWVFHAMQYKKPEKVLCVSWPNSYSVPLLCFLHWQVPPFQLGCTKPLEKSPQQPKLQFCSMLTSN